MYLINIFYYHLWFQNIGKNVHFRFVNIELICTSILAYMSSLSNPRVNKHINQIFEWILRNKFKWKNKWWLTILFTKIHQTIKLLFINILQLTIQTIEQIILNLNGCKNQFQKSRTKLSLLCKDIRLHALIYYVLVLHKYEL